MTLQTLMMTSCCLTLLKKGKTKNDRISKSHLKTGLSKNQKSNQACSLNRSIVKKAVSRQKKLDLINSMNPDWEDLYEKL